MTSSVRSRMNSDETSKARAAEFLAGGGEMGALMRAMDWARTPLGPPEYWPISLKTAVGIMMSSRYAMFVWWGTPFDKPLQRRVPSLPRKKAPERPGSVGPGCVGGDMGPDRPAHRGRFGARRIHLRRGSPPRDGPLWLSRGNLLYFLLQPAAKRPRRG